jgi:hypothetical protein
VAVQSQLKQQTVTWNHLGWQLGRKTSLYLMRDKFPPLLGVSPNAGGAVLTAQILEESLERVAAIGYLPTDTFQVGDVVVSTRYSCQSSVGRVVELRGDTLTMVKFPDHRRAALKANCYLRPATEVEILKARLVHGL